MTNDDLIRLYKHYSDMAYTHLTMDYTEENLKTATRLIANMLTVLTLLQSRYSLNEPDETQIKESQLALILFEIINKYGESSI